MNKINVTRSSIPSLDEYIETIKPLWESMWLTNNGILHQELEKKLEKYLDVKNVSLFANGHLALYNAIKAMNLKGEVITTPFTFISTTHAIIQNNLTPVFCDINPIDYTIDVDKIENLITDKTSAILAVHVYGNVCNVDKICEIAKKYNLKVIYDSAHAFGVKYKNVSICNFGDVSAMSFHATKVFHTVEGGAVVYNDDSLKNKINAFRNFGLINPEECKQEALNAKMSEFHAAMGLCNLKYIDEQIKKRRELVSEYQKKLENVDGIICWKKQDNVEANYIYFPIIVNKEKYGLSRDELFNLLAENNIFSRKYFYPLTCDFECYKKYDADVPIAKNVANSILTLPLYADLSFEDINQICDVIKYKRVIKR